MPGSWEWYMPREGSLNACNFPVTELSNWMSSDTSNHKLILHRRSVQQIWDQANSEVKRLQFHQVTILRLRVIPIQSLVLVWTLILRLMLTWLSLCMRVRPDLKSSSAWLEGVWRTLARLHPLYVLCWGLSPGETHHCPSNLGEVGVKRYLRGFGHLT